MFIYTECYIDSHSNTQNIHLYHKTHPNHQIAFPEIYKTKYKHIFKQKKDIQQIVIVMLLLMVLLIFCFLQQYLLFGVTRRYHIVICNAPRCVASSILGQQHGLVGIIPYPRANERVGIPPPNGGSFASGLNYRINGRNIFRITLAWTLRQFVGNIMNESSPGILTNCFCYHKVNERIISLVFLSIR